MRIASRSGQFDVCVYRSFRPAQPGDRLLELDFGAKALEVAVNHGHGQLSTGLSVGDRAVSRVEVSVDFGFVPMRGVTDISEPEIVLLGPEERDRLKAFPSTKNVPRCSLALALGHNPMFDADSLACQRVRPPRNVASRED